MIGDRKGLDDGNAQLGLKLLDKGVFFLSVELNELDDAFFYQRRHVRQLVVDEDADGRYRRIQLASKGGCRLVRHAAFRPGKDEARVVGM